MIMQLLLSQRACCYCSARWQRDGKRDAVNFFCICRWTGVTHQVYSFINFQYIGLLWILFLFVIHAQNILNAGAFEYVVIVDSVFVRIPENYEHLKKNICPRVFCTLHKLTQEEKKVASWHTDIVSKSEPLVM